MDVFVVVVNVIAVILMFIAAFWVWKFAPDLSKKLGVSRKELLPTAAGTPLDNNGKPTGPDPKNGISGDARPSTVELGKLMFDTKVAFAVKQIQGFIPPKK